MSTVKLQWKGGAKLAQRLREIQSKVDRARDVKVGFLEGRRYPATDKRAGLPVAQVAFWNEFGTTNAPARPFFRNTIREHEGEWPENVAAGLKKTDYDVRKTMSLLGELIKDQIVESIVRWPADNAESTVARKGFNKGLIDTGVMQRSVDYELTEGKT